MKDNNSVVLGEGLAAPHTKEDRGTWVGSGGDTTLLLPFPRPSQEVTSPMAEGDLHRSGVSKRQLDTFEFLPITAWGGTGLFMGCRVEHLGTARHLRAVLAWGGTQDGEGEGSRQLWGGQEWENRRKKRIKGGGCVHKLLVSAACPCFLIKLHF